MLLGFLVVTEQLAYCPIRWGFADANPNGWGEPRREVSSVAARREPRSAGGTTRSDSTRSVASKETVRGGETQAVAVTEGIRQLGPTHHGRMVKLMVEFILRKITN
mmetsp:Transcript_10482/g.15008  ORF Transcript_10482/g.15008 Transcript_10482/m.15008 type:complete len:106 (-) Transcript_10482:192-509(-)